MEGDAVMSRASKEPVQPGFKRYQGYVSVGLVGCKRTFKFDIEDDASVKEIEEAGRDAMFECIEWGYEEEQP